MESAEAWKPFEDIENNQWQVAEKFKTSKGSLVIGHLLPDVPEEVIHAAGAFPIAIEGASSPISLSAAHIPAYTCSHVMGTLDLGLSGQLDKMDALVIPYVCDSTRNLSHLWKQLFPGKPSELLRIPKRIQFGGAREYLINEYQRLYNWACDLTGNKQDPDRLIDSIKLYENSRSLLRKAFEKHRSSPEVWNVSRIRSLFNSAMRSDRLEHVEWMTALPWDSADAVNPSLEPVYIKGKVWDPPQLAEIMDQLGISLAEDETAAGRRSVMVEIAANGDPFEMLADRSLGTIPYTGYHVEPTGLVNDFVQRVKDSKASGVIILNPKFCEAAAFDTPDFVNALNKESIPNLVLETSARSFSIGQLRLRLEAFREMLGMEL
ncbi:MAG: 2-hydroxyacyl-CoA dehydratase subunit D [Desulfomonilaceae bacterium]